MRKGRKGKKDIASVERLEISILLEKGYSLRSIARSLDRGHNTVAYEVQKNSVRGQYDPWKAHHKAQVRKKYRRFEWRKIEAGEPLQEYIKARLTAHWNPDEIAGRMRRDRLPFYASKTAIYEWLRTARGEPYCAYLYSRRRRVKRRKQKAKRTFIPHRVSIEKRPLGAGHRTRYRHCEADTLMSKKGTPGGIKVVYERKARLIAARKVYSMKPKEHTGAMQRIAGAMRVRSFTYDNGIENRDHEKVGIPSYFCDPYSSWQKGGVENANKMIRRYFPKRTDFRSVSQEDIDRVVFIINRKPRKILGYRSALEVAQETGIITNESVLTVG